jgi:hypothetical protein
MTTPVAPLRSTTKIMDINSFEVNQLTKNKIRLDSANDETTILKAAWVCMTIPCRNVVSSLARSSNRGISMHCRQSIGRHCWMDQSRLACLPPLPSNELFTISEFGVCCVLAAVCRALPTSLRRDQRTQHGEKGWALLIKFSHRQ